MAKICLCRRPSVSQGVCSWLICPSVIQCHFTSMPDWSATVSAGCIMASAPGGLFTVCTCMSTCYFSSVLPGTLFHSLWGIHNVCYYVYTGEYTHLQAYTNPNTCNLCPWGGVMWLEHSWLIRKIWTILHTCHLTTDAYTHTHKGRGSKTIKRI